MRTAFCVMLVLLAVGCRRQTTELPAPVAAPASSLAAPVTVPMAVRERLLHDLEQQQQQARARALVMDEAVARDR